MDIATLDTSDYVAKSERLKEDIAEAMKMVMISEAKTLKGQIRILNEYIEINNNRGVGK